jgi:putative glycosyltransferase (TIGR04372 family)
MQSQSAIDGIRDRNISLPKRLRRFVKSKMSRHPAMRRLYAFPSSAARSAKLLRLRAIDKLLPKWIGPRVQLALHCAGDGEHNRAAAIADDALGYRPEATLDTDALLQISSIYQRAGRFADVCRLMESVEARRREAIETLQYDRLPLRFFSWPMAIGTLGMLDRYTKAEILGIIPRRTNIVLGDPANSANPAYLRYWEKYFAFITEPRAISQLAPLARLLPAEIGVLVGNNRRVRDMQLQWESEGRGPLLSLSDEHRERGYRLLRELGVPDGAWFVGLHVREASSYQERILNLRNADILTYRLAVDEIAARGGWVLRMGDASMRSLPPWLNTIDYAHSGRRADWMDVFLWAEGRFFIATDSGPQLIPTTFGKPIAFTNHGPLAHIFCAKDGILLPKHYWHERDRRHLTIVERLSDSYGVWEYPDLFHAVGLRVIDNTPEELRDLVVEMMDRLEGRHVETEQERAFNARFAQLAISHHLYPVKIARAFISTVR